MPFQPVPDREWDPELWARTLKGPHRAAFRVEVWAGGEQQTESAPYDDGSVTETWVTAGPRWSLSLRIPATPSWRRWLKMPALELRPYRGLRLPGRGSEPWWCPLGRFPLQQPALQRPWTTLGLAADDYWQWVSDGKWPLPMISPGGPIRDQLAWALRDAGLDGATITASSTAAREPVFIDKQRDEWVGIAARSISAQVSLDRVGQPVIEDVPALGATTSDLRGVVTSLAWTPDWSATFNAVDVSSSAPDVQIRYRATLPAEHPASPWRMGGADRPRWKVYQFSSPLLENEDQGIKAAWTTLARVSQASTQWTYTAVPDPTRSASDTVLAPLLDGGTQRVQIASIQTPLVAQAAQRLVTVDPSVGGPE